ncbi:rRNA maturation RNase YbeY [Mycoplasma enhydrae]|uniref:rRNA maturation RNase YbeY n=1 Tax=Mycoplasma enhydrae TaxID=2499220 RepID=UPI0021E91DD1|nr:rRNA maturation RNase YbeY [Mycoplasma enhydrae]MCV3753529.1 rRNA maturation RNase YbeY [Mycoplasma enhydrae]
MKEFLDILDASAKEFGVQKKLLVDVLFVNKFKMKKLNFRYRNKNYTTDILSFPLDAQDELSFLDEIYLGQIIISPWKIKKQAKEFNHSIRREFCYIFAHGIAHLFGYDHQTEQEASTMNAHVDNIMNILGIKRQ